jgi:hypothetical protein
MALTLDGNTPGEICRNLAEQPDELRGLLVVAFTPDGFLTWSLTGQVSVTAMQVAIEALTQQLQRTHTLAVIEPMGNA